MRVGRVVAVAASALVPAAVGHAGTLPLPVRLARADLAMRTHVPVASVTVTRQVRVTWPDSCLGVRAPELCAQVLTPGYSLTLSARGRRCVYHTDLRRTFRYAGCHG
jgi:hypothetical protein